MTWLMTWRVASSQGMRLPLCQILEVVWIGMRVGELLDGRAEHRYSTAYRDSRGRVTGRRAGKPERVARLTILRSCLLSSESSKQSPILDGAGGQERKKQRRAEHTTDGEP